MNDTDLKEQAKRQAECCIAYAPCPICDPEPGDSRCPLCHGGPGVPMQVQSVPDPEPKQHLLPATRGCRGGIHFGLNATQIHAKNDAYNGGCTGCHVNYPVAERPKLPALTPAQSVKRILATPMWRGSTVTEHADPANPGRLHHYLISHPSGAVATIWVGKP